MPLIKVKIIEGRSARKKESLIRELTKTTSDVLDAPSESVRVLITEVPATHWGIAGQSVEKIRGTKN